MRKVFFATLLIVLSLNMWGQDFYFVQITDTHLGIENHENITSELIEKINNLPFDVKFVVHTGDIFQNNLKEKSVRASFHKLTSEFKMPFYAVPGNHDLLPEKYRLLSRIYKKEIGPLNQLVKVEGVNMIFFYSIPFADTELPDVKSQKQWIVNALDSLSEEQVILFHHQPSVGDFYNNEMHDSWPPEMVLFWKELLNRDKVDAVICGHFHRDELHWLGQVPVYVSSSIAGFWERQASFRIYHYQGGRLSYQTVYYYEERSEN